MCNPSRVSVLTGISPVHSRVFRNPTPWRSALPDAVTLPQAFMRHGYQTLRAGKIFHGHFMDPPSWNTAYPSKTANEPIEPLPPHIPLNGLSGGSNFDNFDWGSLDVPDAEMSDSKVTTWIINQIQTPRNQPVFLACGLSCTHLPWYVPQKYFHLFPLDKIKLPLVKNGDLDDIPKPGRTIALLNGRHRRVIDAHQWRKAVQAYLASIAFVDAQVGRLIDALDQSRIADNTIIVFWSDHGWSLGQKQHWTKFALWEQDTRVPLIIVAPGVTHPGSRCDRPVSLLDIYPTLLDLAGLPPRKKLDGVSLRPLLENPDAPWYRPAITYLKTAPHWIHYAVRSQRWRYIHYANGDQELYDQVVDPHEWNNLADDSKLAGVMQQLSQWVPDRLEQAHRARSKKKARQSLAVDTR